MAFNSCLWQWINDWSRWFHWWKIQRYSFANGIGILFQSYKYIYIYIYWRFVQRKNNGHGGHVENIGNFQVFNSGQFRSETFPCPISFGKLEIRTVVNSSSPLFESFNGTCLYQKPVNLRKQGMNENEGGKMKERKKSRKICNDITKIPTKILKSFCLSLFLPPSSSTIVEIFSHVKLSENKIKNTQRNYIGCRVEFVRSFVRSFRSSVGEKKMEWNSRGMEEKPSITAVRDEHSIASNIFRAETRCISVSWLSPVVQLLFRTRNEN